MDRDDMICLLKECTGLEETSQCYQIMENHNWNIEAAVDFVLTHLQTSDMVNNLINEPILIDDSPDQSIIDDSNDVFFTIEVLYNELRNKLLMKRNDSIGNLKHRIRDTMNIPVEEQVITELAGLDDNTLLADCACNDISVLHVQKGSSNNTLSSSNIPLNVRFNVRLISRRRGAGSRSRHIVPVNYSIELNSNMTFVEAKAALTNASGIPANKQNWQRYSLVDENERIGLFLRNGCTVNVSVVDDLITPSANHSSGGSHSSNASTISNSLSSNGDCLMTDDCIFITDPISDSPPAPTPPDTTTSISPIKSVHLSLLPDDCKDETDGIETFIQKFADKYGPNVPTMYIGSLANAIKDSLDMPIKERRLLAIYVHNVRSICVNVFCNQILMNEFVNSFLHEHYILWPWDISNELNRRWLLSNLQSHFGQQISEPIERMDVDQFPVIVVLSKTRSSYANVGIITGSENMEAVVERLTTISDQFEIARAEEIVVEEEREHRNQIQKEQDQAYHASLVRDKEKLEKLRLEEQIRIKSEHESEVREKEKLQKQRMLESQLPNEPDAHTNQNIYTVRIRVPNGESYSRNFFPSDPLKSVFNFMGSKGYFIEHCKLLTSYPRTDLSLKDPDTILSQAGIHRRELLTLELKDTGS